MWILVGDWELSLVSRGDEDEFEGKEGIEKPALFGEIDLTLGTRVCCKRRVRQACLGNHQTSYAGLSAAFLVGLFLVIRACQVEVWERCLIK